MHAKNNRAIIFNKNNNISLELIKAAHYYILYKMIKVQYSQFILKGFDSPWLKNDDLIKFIDIGVYSLCNIGVYSLCNIYVSP